MAKQISKAEDLNAKMWACGKWLERILNDPWTLDNFREMAADALRILDISFELKEDEPTLACLAKMESLADPEKPLFEQWADVMAHIPYMFYHEASEAIMFENGGNAGLNSLDDIQTPDIGAELGPLTATHEGIIAVLKKLLSNPKPWNVALIEILETERHPVVRGVLELNVLGGSFCIVSGYGAENGSVKRINTFQPPSDGLRPLFRWNTTFARMFLTFLESGGKDYFIFCEHCGRFTVVQRKGRKRFCSDICRVYEHQEKTGTGAKILQPLPIGKRQKKAR